MALTREARGRGVDVRGPEMLGTLATPRRCSKSSNSSSSGKEGEVAPCARSPAAQPAERTDAGRTCLGHQLGERKQVKLIMLDSAARLSAAELNSANTRSGASFSCSMLSTEHFSAMLDTSKPLLVVVNGPAFGGGAELAALGDLVIATPRARFSQPEIKLGVFPPLAAVVLPYILGPKLALELVLTGETLTAERAREVGLVNWLVPEDKAAESRRNRRESDRAVRPGAHDGEEGHPWQPGTVIARGRSQFDEGLPQRTCRPRGFPRRSSRPGRKARPEVEESLKLSRYLFVTSLERRPPGAKPTRILFVSGVSVSSIAALIDRAKRAAYTRRGQISWLRERLFEPEDASSE